MYDHIERSATPEPRIPGNHGLSLRVFGTVTLLNARGETIPTQSAQARAILQALALAPGNRLSRAQMAKWFSACDAEAFRRALNRARRSLGDARDVIRTVAEHCIVDTKSLPTDLSTLLSHCLTGDPPEPPAINEPFLPLSPALRNGNKDDHSEGHSEWHEWLAGRTEALREEIRTAIMNRLGELTNRRAIGHGVALSLLLLRVCKADEEAALCAIRYAVETAQLGHAQRLRGQFEDASRADDSPVSPQFRAQMEAWAVPAPPPRPSRAPEAGTPDAREPATPRSQRLPSIGVCAFRNGTQDEKYDYVGAALADSVIAGLARSPWFPVRAVDLPATYQPTGVQFGPDQDDSYLVTGTYYITEDGQARTIQLNTRLTHTSDPTAVTADDLSMDFANHQQLCARVVDRIVAKVADGVLNAEQIRAAQSGALPLPAEESDTWHLIARARYYFWKTSRENNRLARDLLDRALESSPQSIPALVTAAFVRLLDVWSFWSQDSERDLSRARELAKVAVHAAAKDPWAYFTLGTVLGASGELEEAVSLFDHALELQPSFAPALGERARLKLFLGRIAEAEAEALAACRMNASDPHYTLWLHTLGMVAFLKQDFSAAHDWAGRARAARGFWFHNHLLMAAAQHRLGAHTVARTCFEKAMRLAPGFNRKGYRHSHPFANPAHENAFFDALAPYF